MTGFGRASLQHQGAEATVEMRSVNNRYCDVSVRLPRALAEREADVQAHVKAAFARGRITVQVQLEQSTDAALSIRVDEEAARAYARLLEHLREAAGFEEPVRLEHLLRFSDVFTTPDDDEKETGADETAWEAVQAALDEATEALRAMRRQEGEALQADLLARADAIKAALQHVEARAPDRVTEARQKLHDRLQDLLESPRLNEDRLELEITLLADKLDVTEEGVRLRSHLALFREALHSDEPVGRKLNFLAQEMGREINTIGSKANDAEIAHLAVEMKEELEKIREQVQNVE
ncbi:MAG: YicC/YloC family endoribonuclease [Rhodothermales bacterium]